MYSNLRAARRPGAGHSMLPEGEEVPGGSIHPHSPAGEGSYIKEYQHNIPKSTVGNLSQELQLVVQ